MRIYVLLCLIFYSLFTNAQKIFGIQYKVVDGKTYIMGAFPNGNYTQAAKRRGGDSFLLEKQIGNEIQQIGKTSTRGLNANEVTELFKKVEDRTSIEIVDNSGLFFTIDIYRKDIKDMAFKCLKGDCENGYGERVLLNGYVYKGDFKNGKQQGKGNIYNGKYVLQYGTYENDSAIGKCTNYQYDIVNKKYALVSTKEVTYSPVFKSTTPNSVIPSTNLHKIVAGIKNLDNKTPNPDYIIFKAKQKGNEQGYNSLKQAKDAAKGIVGDEVIVQSRKTGKIKLYDAVTVKNTTINSTIANSAFNAQLSNDPAVDVSYDGIKMNFDRQLYLMNDFAEEDESTLDVLDENGLSLIGDDITGDIARGTRGMSMIFDKELIRKNAGEALAAYKYFDKMTKATPNIDIIKSTRISCLTKMYKAGLEGHRNYVDEEMTKYNYTEVQKKYVTDN